MNYYEMELAKINFIGPTPATILVGSEGRVTKTLNLNAECAAALINRLVEVFILRPATAAPALFDDRPDTPAVTLCLNFKLGRDLNGNKTLRVSRAGGDRAGFTIQTNSNLPNTDRNGITDKTPPEVKEFVAHYGTARQKRIVFGYG